MKCALDNTLCVLCAVLTSLFGANRHQPSARHYRKKGRVLFAALTTHVNSRN